ncbi:hypothetical protein GN244_ATG16982 [Phytophthora infestans]|uniref:Transmembrane protein n=1 Tax=Phytophthora infestans TaxID=4787 RepID=A0A833ST30_PHYIN|nr:hypothetical protein GN244_ATG16982 [Phytophthora infestans]KAF4146726.1 hypothetical protein GN958_ATG04085 [Phytophthora infestans]
MSRRDLRQNRALLLLVATLLCGLMEAIDVVDGYGHRVFRRLDSLDGRSIDVDVTVAPVEKHQEQEDLTMQPSISDDSSDSSFPSTSIIIVTVGLIVLVGLVILLVVLRRGRSDPGQSECNVHQPPENSRFCMKRTTFAVPEAGHSDHVEIDSSGSVVPVLGDNALHRKIEEANQHELKPSWAEASSYSVAPLSSRHTRPAVPMLIYTPARGRGLTDSHPASDYSQSSHTDDYSIGMLESPVSTEYSFGSEADDVFLSTHWDEVDSYRSMDYTFLSTTSSDVFGSNRARNGGAWKQVYGPNDTPPGQTRLSTGTLFVRTIDPTELRRMRLDTRAYGTRGNRMRFDVEV